MEANYEQDNKNDKFKIGFKLSTQEWGMLLTALTGVAYALIQGGGPGQIGKGG